MLTGACVVFASALATSAAQAPPTKTVSTASGVYTSAQAARGEQTYMASCVACHPPSTYAAAAFRGLWNGKPLSDLYRLIRETMPKEEPRSLEPKEYAQVVAYMLRINGAPAGKEELPSDVRTLRRIRISMPATAGK